MPHDAKRIEKSWTRIRALAHRHRLQLILTLRVTVGALLALALAQALHLRLPLWAVLTSLIVTQMSVGRSLKVATDYLVGTFLGVAYGGALAILIPHTSEWALLGVLALAVAPLALIASFRANFNVLPVTAVIVLLVPTIQHVSPAASALDRVLEVVVGGSVGFIVSILVWPSRGHEMTTDAAAAMLDLIADALGELLREAARAPPDEQRLRRIQDGIGGALARLNAIGAEAEHERSARLTSAPDTGPLLRTLLRLRHDIVMLGRAAGCELPPEVARRLAPPLQQIATAATDFLRKSGAALGTLEPPPLDAVDAAFKAYGDEFDAVRRDGLTRDMSGETVERFFALGFALEQLREHLSDLHRVVGEWAKA